VLRDIMDNDGFIEVETPILHPVKSGANAKPFMTRYNSLKADYYLRIATELYLKRLIIGGVDRVYEIGKNFRNEGIDTRHNPEFTMIDLYQAYADYNDMMKLAEKLLRTTSKEVNGSEVIPWDKNIIDMSIPFTRMPMTDAASKAINADLLSMSSDEAILIAKKNDIYMKPNSSWGAVVEEIFNAKVEKTLIQPTFVIDIPYDISPLAKIHRKNSRLAERFMLYVGGIEFGEAYSELTDPIVQRKKFEEQVAAGDEESQQMDTDFINALEYGMPPTGGMGIGTDRLAMLITNSTSIRDILAFPTLRQKIK